MSDDSVYVVSDALGELGKTSPGLVPDMVASLLKLLTNSDDSVRQRGGAALSSLFDALADTSGDQIPPRTYESVVALLNSDTRYPTCTRLRSEFSLPFFHRTRTLCGGDAAQIPNRRGY